MRRERKLPSFPGDGSRELCGHFLTKQNILLPQTVAILLLGRYSENLKMMSLQNLYLGVYKHPNSVCKAWKQAEEPLGRREAKLWSMTQLCCSWACPQRILCPVTETLARLCLLRLCSQCPGHGSNLDAYQ